MSSSSVKTLSLKLLMVDYTNIYIYNIHCIYPNCLCIVRYIKASKVTYMQAI